LRDRLLRDGRLAPDVPVTSREEQQDHCSGT